MLGPLLILTVALSAILLVRSLWQLWLFEVASLAETRKVDLAQARRIYYQEFNNDDGPARKVPVDESCRRNGLSAKLLFWRRMVESSLVAPALIAALAWWGH